jgi:hypothetical protein
VILTVTLDTNVLDREEIAALQRDLDRPCEFAAVSVSVRERGNVDLDLVVVPETAVWDESRWDEAVWSGPFPELLVIDESPLGRGVLADDQAADLFEATLQIISNGSFPSTERRNTLSAGSRRQLRDAMVFEAHVRRRRHVLVTNDVRGFVNDGRREALERLGRTRILTPAEFRDHVTGRRLDELLPA